MSCVEFGRRLLRAVVAHVTQLPYHEFEQRVHNWRLLAWLCREMMKLLGGTHEWDGFPADEPIDTPAVFKVMKEGIDYKWSHFVVYMDWLMTTLAPDCAYHTWQTLKKHHPQDNPGHSGVDDALARHQNMSKQKRCRHVVATPIMSAYTDPQTPGFIEWSLSTLKLKD